MEALTTTTLLLLLILILTLSLKLLTTTKKPPLPPGPSSISFFLNNIVLKKKSLFELEQILRELHSAHGPIICLQGIRNSTVFIQGRGPTHRALVQRSASIADRPPHTEPMLFLTHNHRDINSSSGPLWRLLRRNLAAEMLHPSRIKQFAPARQWAMHVLIRRLSSDPEAPLRESFQLAMFSLMVAMCFGEKLGQDEIKEIQEIQYSLLLLYTRFNYFAVLPRIAKVVFRRKWDKIAAVRRRQEELFGALIRSRRERRGEFEYSYVDSLLGLELAEEGGRRLTDGEMVNLCHEFLSGGTDTTSTGLEWIMAELIKNPEIQEKIVEEMPAGSKEVTEEDLQKMQYLKAVIMEGLRRHPPGHFTLPHMAAEDVELDGYLVPKGADVHFNISEVGRDGEVWEEPMEFRPERFLDGGKTMDITGSKEIKMMPFGVGRRMCPGYGLAIMHLEYFVANLVREFEWKAEEGEEVDLSEMLEFTTVMKNPLRARVLPRENKVTRD